MTPRDSLVVDARVINNDLETRRNSQVSHTDNNINNNSNNNTSGL